MSKEQLIAKILSYKASAYDSSVYDVKTNGKWDKKKLNALWNLTLHMIWRELRLKHTDYD